MSIRMELWISFKCLIGIHSYRPFGGWQTDNENPYVCCDFCNKMWVRK